MTPGGAVFPSCPIVPWVAWLQSATSLSMLPTFRDFIDFFSTPLYVQNGLMNNNIYLNLAAMYVS